jgi:hypothetical protein
LGIKPGTVKIHIHNKREIASWVLDRADGRRVPLPLLVESGSAKLNNSAGNAGAPLDLAPEAEGCG